MTVTSVGWTFGILRCPGLNSPLNDGPTAPIAIIETYSFYSQISRSMEGYQKVQHILKDARGCSIETITANVAARDIHIHRDSAGDGAEHEVVKVANWLSSMNYRLYHNEVVSRRTENTGLWFIQGMEYQAWLSGGSRTLWATGMPGAGKTVLASTILDHLRSQRRCTPTEATVFVYCRYMDNCTTSSIFLTFIRQLLELQTDAIYPVLLPTYTEHRTNQTKPTEAGAIQLLKVLLPLFSRTQAVIDGLDEITDDERAKFLTNLSSLPIHSVILSRPLDLYIDLLPSVIQVSVEAKNEDIEAFLVNRIHGSPRLRRLVQGKQALQDITAKIKDNSQGMFLVASLQVEALKGCLNMKSLTTALNSLPSGVNDMYLLTLKRIDDQTEEESSLAKHALVWLTHANRALKMSELQDALATSYATGVYEPDAVTHQDIILSVCCGLVVVDEASGEVRLIHYTAQEYLSELTYPPFSDSPEITTLTCTTYLLHYELPQQSLGNYAALEQFFSNGPFLSYAYEYWGLHARDITEAEKYHRPDVLRCVSEFLQKCEAVPYPHRYRTTGKLPALHERFMKELLYPCHLVALFGLTSFLSFLTHQDTPTTALRRTGLHISVLHNREFMVEALINGVVIPPSNVNSQDMNGDTALHMAVHSDNQTIIRLLLIHPTIDVNMSNGTGNTALVDAAEGGSVASVAQLLRHTSIDVNAHGGLGQTALMAAVSRPQWGDREEIIRLLLAHCDINPNIADRAGNSPLLEASSRGLEPICRLLLSHPLTDPNIRSRESIGALVLAMQGGNQTVVQALLAHKETKVNQPHSFRMDGFTSLAYAIYYRLVWAVRLLVEHPSADLNMGTSGSRGLTPLMLASFRNYKDLVEILLKHPSVNVNARVSGDTAISLCILLPDKREEKLMQLQYQFSQPPSKDISLQNRHQDRESDSFAIISLLISHPSLDPNLICDGEGRTPLMIACEQGCELAVRNLLFLPKIPDHVEGLGDPSAQNGTQLISKMNIDVNARDLNDEAALIHAWRGNHVEIVKLLLLHSGLDPQVREIVASSMPRLNRAAVIKSLLSQALLPKRETDLTLSAKTSVLRTGHPLSRFSLEILSHSVCVLDIQARELVTSSRQRLNRAAAIKRLMTVPEWDTDSVLRTGYPLSRFPSEIEREELAEELDVPPETFLSGSTIGPHDLQSNTSLTMECTETSPSHDHSHFSAMDPPAVSFRCKGVLYLL